MTQNLKSYTMIETPSTEFQINRRTIINNITALFSGSAIAQAIAALTFILTARQLGPEQYGQYTSSMVFATFCSIVFSLGLNIWLLREGGRLPSGVGNLTGSIIGIKLSIGIVWLFVMFMIASRIESDSIPANLLRLGAVIIWFDSMFMTALTGFRSILRNSINSLLLVASAFSVLLVTLFLVYSGVYQASIFMIGRAIILFLSLLVSLIVAWNVLKLSLSSATAKIALIQSPPYAVSEFLAWAYRRVDVLIIAFMLNDYAVGLYAPAVGIINALYLVPMAIHFVMVPVLSNLFSTDVRQAWITARRFIGVLILVGLGLFLLLFFGGKYLIYLLGPAYASSQEILQILSAILFIHSITFGVAAILVATNQQKQRTIIQAVAVVINVGLNFLIIQRFGITGVAYIYVLTEVVLLLGYVYLVLRYWLNTHSNKPGIGAETG